MWKLKKEQNRMEMANLFDVSIWRFIIISKIAILYQFLYLNVVIMNKTGEQMLEGMCLCVCEAWNSGK